MSWFARIEEACAAFIERTFAKTFPSDLEPAQIARKLVATMEARTQSEDGQLRAPDQYLVFVNPSDFERLAPHRSFLQREWAALLTDMAGRVGLSFASGEPLVRLDERREIVAGAVEIDAWHADDEPTLTGQRPPAKTYRLRMLKGVPAYAVYTLSPITRIGRSEDRDIFLVDPSVSRTHALIEFDSGWPVVHDLGSTNGTYVNGERISSRRLSPGDVIAFGDTRLALEVHDA